MPVDIEELTEIADVSVEDYIAAYKAFNNISSRYYQKLEQQSILADSTVDKNYAQVAYAVSNNSGIRAIIENEFTKVSAAKNDKNLTVASDEWLKYQYYKMRADIAARSDDIINGGDGKLNAEQMRQVNLIALNASGLPPTAYIYYEPLRNIAEHQPSELQAYSNKYYGDDGLKEAILDALAIDYNRIIKYGDNDLLRDIASELRWNANVLAAITNVLGAYEPSAPDYEQFRDLSDDLEDALDSLGLVADRVAEFPTWLDQQVDAGLHALNNWLQWVKDFWDPRKNANNADGSPLVLDLGETGIHLLDRAQSEGVYWDIDRDGFREASGWVGPEDGLLALDRNNNGVIDDNSELFGDQPASGMPNGFATLALLDTNNDGQITSADAAFGDLIVWVDGNSDGISQESELKTLSSLGITAISLNYTNTNYTLDGNSIRQESTFVMNGQTRSIVDAWFSYDNINTEYNGDYTLDVRTLFLPDTRGYGDLPDLHIAMSKDETLLEMVQELAAQSLQQLLNPAFNLQQKLADILFRWAGVEGNDPDRFGLGLDRFSFDAREFDFVNKLFAENTPYNIWAGNSAYHGAWQMALAPIAASILSQAGFHDLLDGAAYNSLTGNYEGGLASTGAAVWFGSGNSDNFSTTTMTDIYVFQTGNGQIVNNYPDTINYNPDNQGSDIILFGGVDPDDVRMWSDYAGMFYIQYGENDILRIGMPVAYAQANRVTNYVYQIAFDDGTVWDMSNGLIMIDTDEGHYSNAGSIYDDIIDGRGGNDAINGYEGNDILIGGTGQDTLNGGLGDDTYVFSIGDSSLVTPDYIYETLGEGTDTIKFTGGILSTDIRMFSDAYGTLLIQYSSTDIIRVQSSFDYNTSSIVIQNYFETIEFDDGIVWDLTTGLPITDTDESHFLYGSLLDDVIDGRGGNDGIWASAGNDIITGGLGRDDLNGGTGNDTYIFRVGDSLSSDPDRVWEYAGEGTDTIKLTGGILPSQVTLSANYNYLYIQYSPNDTIVLSSDYDNSRDAYISNVENIAFDDGTVWNFSTGFVKSGTSSDNQLSGTSLIDILNGEAGNDTLYGQGNDDTLNGGAGNDMLYGGMGSDTYVYNSGDGSDTINDLSGDSDVIQLGEGYNLANTSVVRVGSNNLAIMSGEAQLILIQNQFVNGNSIETIRFIDNTILNLLAYSYTINGTVSADTIYGTSYGAGGDIINGLDGDDYIYAGIGDDIVSGGNGNDYIYGDQGNDTLRGNAGDDFINSGSGDDIVIYDSGADIIQDEGGIDVIQITTEGITSPNVTFVRNIGNQNDLEVLFNGVHAFDINYQFYTGYGFETLQFANGSTVSLFDIQYTINGTSSGDTIYGISTGGNPDDVLNGNAGNDTIYGYDGNDLITGGTGNDILNGGFGNDKYYYNSGDGIDTLSDQSGADVIEIGSGFLKSDLSWKRDGGSNNMTLLLQGNVVMTINNQFVSNNQIEVVKFSDGQAQSLVGLQISTDGTEADDYLTGITANASINDVINGFGGNDSIYGGDGNDLIIGGIGNDVLNGDAGDDTYVYNSGDGVDVISDSSGTDIIQIGAGYEVDDLTWQRSNNDLRLYLNSVLFTTVQNHFTTGYSVESVIFSDNSTFDLTDLSITQSGNGTSETLNGTVANDFLNGFGGDDYLYGYGGNDTLNGGIDRDYLYGDLGDDTYVFIIGDSSISSPDRVYENVGEGTDTIKFTGGILPSNVRMWTDNQYLHIRYSETDEILVQSSWDSSGASTIGTYVERIAFDNGVVWDLTNGLNVTDTDESHSIIGSSMADNISGAGGDDYLYGYGGNDTLNGGMDRDYLYGGLGDDTYVFNTGDSSLLLPDRIYESIGEGIDTIKLTGGILPSNVRMWTENQYLHIRYSETDEILVQSSWDSSGASTIGTYVERIAFDNGVVWDLTNGLNMTDTDEAHSIIGSSLSDFINGAGGNDSIYGYGGNDTISGGAGRDYLYGGLGDDTYVFAPGFGSALTTGTDNIYESIEEGTDTIRITGGVTPDQIRLWVDSSGDMHIRFAADPNDELVVDGYINSNGTDVPSRVERIVFDSGLTWDLTQGLRLFDTDDSHTIYGSSGNDIIQGNGGNDNIYDYGGNDTYAFNVGFGQDYIVDQYGTSVIQFGEGITLNDIRFWRSNSSSDLQIFVGENGDKITLSGQLYDLQSGTNTYDEFTNIYFANGSTLNISDNLKFTGTSSGETVYGTKGNDKIVGLGGDDYLNGYGGNDTYIFNTGFGQDYIVDESGNDVIQFGQGISLSDLRFWRANSSSDLQIFVGSNGDKITLSGQLYDLLTGTNSYDEIEEIRFSDNSVLNLSENITFTGTSSSETVYGTGGDDIIVGLNGDDSLYGYGGDDTYRFTVGFGQDYIVETSGNDVIQFGAGIVLSDLRFWRANSSSDLQIFVGTSGDKITLSSQLYDIMNHDNAYDEVETILFADNSTFDLRGNLTFTGTSYSETVYGTNGHDTIVGLQGDDSLYGYEGDDTYLLNVGFGQDYIIEMSGNDVIQFGAGIVLSDLRFWRANSSSDLQIFVGVSGDKVMLSNQLYDIMNGENSYDEIETIRFADNTTFDLSGALTFTGTSYSESVYGTGVNDTIVGLGGDDALYGYAGNDILIGGAGNDYLSGGAGADKFVLTTDTLGFIDVFVDFSISDGDQIDISQLIESYNPLTHAITDFIEITTNGSNSILKVDTDGGGNNFVQVATISGITGLTDEAALVSAGTIIA